MVRWCGFLHCFLNLGVALNMSITPNQRHCRCLRKASSFKCPHHGSYNIQKQANASKPVEKGNHQFKPTHRTSSPANMADPGGQLDLQSPSTLTFSSFPSDVQLSILSFLSPADLSSFSLTSKTFLSLFSPHSALWYALCDRRFGSKTRISKWGDGNLDFKHLYKILHDHSALIGFWRRIGGGGSTATPNADPSTSSPLVLFDWGLSFVSGSRVSASTNGGYGVSTTPFVWISVSPEGEVVSYLDPYCTEQERDLVAVSVRFMGKGHVFVEESSSRRLEIESGSSSSNSSSPETRKGKGGWLKGGSCVSFGGEEVEGVDFENLIGSPPDRFMSEMYQNLANKTSPRACVERAWRRQKRRGRERRGWRRWEPEHMVKITDCCPTLCRPLQGLWKGICDDNSLDLYLVTYDELGGIACRKVGVGDSSKPFSGGLPVFWTTDATFIESPFSSEEEQVYSTRVHLNCPIAEAATPYCELLHPRDDKVVSRLMCINSGHDIVIPDLAENFANPSVEGRIWQYADGTFGFGFLRDNFIVDLKPIAEEAHFLYAN